MMRSTTKIILALICGVILIALTYFSGITNLLTIEQLKVHRMALRRYVDAHYLQTVVWYICLYFLVAALALPAASVFTIGGGFMFGTLTGTLYTCIGATLGATAVFLMVRYYFGAYVQQRYHKQLQRFNAEFAEYGTYYLLSVRLVSVIPFFVINVCAGLTRTTVAQFVITTVIGILPGSLVYSYAGKQLMHINSLGDVVTAPVIIAFCALALLSLLPVIIQKAVRLVVK